MTQVQWYPGHMAKAFRLMEEELKSVDFIIECRDARAPDATRNPVIAQRLINKPRLILLTKKDLASETASKGWVNRLESEGNVVLVLDVHKDGTKRLVLEKVAEIMAAKRERDKKRGIKPRAAKALIVGVPNVGKSTVINKLSGRKAANAENRPGVTQHLQKVKVNKDLELVDTPGVLWPKFDSEIMGIHTALVGSIKQVGFPIELVTDYARDILLENEYQALQEYYNVEVFSDFYADIARSRGFLSDDGLDVNKARQIFLQDVQNGKICRYTWD